MSENKLSNSWRVKLYELEVEGTWRDLGTGIVTIQNSSNLGAPAILIKDENELKLILQSKVSPNKDIYERQNENIIMWRECNPTGEVDLALSFQDSQGCEEIWNEIGNYHNQLQYNFIGSTFHDENNFFSSPDNTILCNSTTMNMQLHLPFCNITNLQEIRDLLLRPSSLHQKDVIISLLRENDFGYLNQLVQLFYELEEEEEVEEEEENHKPEEENDKPEEDNFKPEEDNHKPEGKTHEEAHIHFAEIWRAILFLNDGGLFEHIVGQCLIFLAMASALEYYPQRCSAIESYKTFLTKTANFVQVLRPMAPSLKRSVQKLFNLRFLKEELLPATSFSDPLADGGPPAGSFHMVPSGISSLINAISQEICGEIFMDIEYLKALLRVIEENQALATVEPIVPILNEVDGNTDTTVEDVQIGPMPMPVCEDSQDKMNIKYSRLDCLRYLSHLFQLSKQQSMERRIEIYNITFDGSGRYELRSLFFRALGCVIYPSNQCTAEIILAIDIISCVTTVAPHLFRLSIIEGPLPPNPSTMSNGYKEYHSQSVLCTLIIHLIDGIEIGIEELLGDSIRHICDVDRMATNHKDSFLTLWYEYYMPWLAQPILQLQLFSDNNNNNTQDKQYKHITQKHQFHFLQNHSNLSERFRIIFDIICQCTVTHTYRMKYFAMRTKLIGQSLLLLKSNHQPLQLGPLRFLKVILTLKEDFYFRHLVKCNIFELIFELLNYNKQLCKDNLVTSMIYEILEYIRIENISILIDYIVEKYTKFINDNELFIESFEKLKLRYDQKKSGGLSSTTGSTILAADSGVGVGRKRSHDDEDEAYLLNDDDDDDSDVIKGPAPNPNSNNIINNTNNANAIQVDNPAWAMLLADYEDDEADAEAKVEAFSLETGPAQLQCPEALATLSSQCKEVPPVATPLPLDPSTLSASEEPPLPPLRPKYETDDEIPLTMFFNSRNANPATTTPIQIALASSSAVTVLKDTPPIELSASTVVNNNKPISFAVKRSKNRLFS